MSVFEALANEQIPDPYRIAPQRRAPEKRPVDPRRRLLRISTAMFGVMLAFLLAVGGWWMLQGGHFYVVSTPSMSPVAPVGSLVLAKNFDPSKVVVGSIIVFHPPAMPDSTFTHRVVAITPEGYKTKGDADLSEDPWVVPRDHVVGIAVHDIPALGWVVRALPWLILGFLIAVIAAAYVPWRWGVFVPLLAVAVIITAPMLILRPLVRPQELYRIMDGPKHFSRLVNNGLLPLKFRIGDGAWVKVPSGHFVDLTIPPIQKGKIDIVGQVDLGWLGWLVLIGICLTPLFAGLSVSVREWRKERRGTLYDYVDITT